jgi:excinuclease ABC subunit B
VLAAIETIKEELAERLKHLGKGKLVEAQRLEQRTRFDLEMLASGPLQGHRELLAPSLGAKPGDPPPTLVDYLPTR